MSAFSPTHWVIFAVIVAALIYAAAKAVIGIVKLRAWRRERAERKQGALK